MARNPSRQFTFQFKQFAMSNQQSAMKIGTDGVLLGAWVPITLDFPLNIWDVGAGTGLIALMLAQRSSPQTRIHAIEIDNMAAAEARLNVESSPWPNKIHVVQADFMQCIDSLPHPHLIVSNPPFFLDGITSPDHARAMARHARTLSYANLLQVAADRLLPGGALAMIAPSDADSLILESATFSQMHPEVICHVAANASKPPKRTLWLLRHRRYASATQYTSLMLNNPDGSRSTNYLRLVDPFYIR